MEIKKLNKITEHIIGCAIEVHREIGPGLLESIYERALCEELGVRGISFDSQVSIPVIYKGKEIATHRLDLLIENEIIVEIKAVENHNSVFEAQLLSYLKMADKKIGLLINFNVPLLKDGVKRIIL